MLIFKNTRIAHSQKLRTQPLLRRATGACAIEGLEARQLFATVPVAGGVPLLSSNPSATAKLYLDFDGDPASGNVPATPAYDVDGDPTTFNNTGDNNLHTEIDNIRQIFGWVAKKFSPFNIDVTTIQPSSYPDRVALHMIVGGNGSWLSTSGPAGFASTGSFYNSSSNIIYAFSDNFGGAVNWVANTVALEAGRAFGLQNQSVYDANGVKTTQYNPGNSQFAPIMGNPNLATRGLWWYGNSSVTDYNFTTGKNVPRVQDDVALLAGTDNAFGYRADDSGNSAATARAISGTMSGIIETASDVDYFSFTTTGGQASIVGTVATYGAMLNLKLQLFNASGQQIASADTATLGETLSANLAAGTYYVAVSGHGLVACLDANNVNQGSGYELGSYTLSVGAPAGNTPAAPSSLAAAVVSSSQIDLAWANVTNESGYKIERSSDGSAWSQIGTVGMDVTTYQNSSGLGAGIDYKYRVRASNQMGDSPYSPIGSGMTTPAPLTVAAGNSVTFPQSQQFTTLSIAGTATLTAGANRVLVTNALSITGAGRLDLGNGSLIVNNGTVAAVRALIASAQAGGTWTGAGIGSSNAGSSAGGLTSLGVAMAGDILGISGSQTAVWNGQTVTATSVLVKYTYAGDANLDGRLNGDDYFVIDANYGRTIGSISWISGDFNYDTKINGDDYFILDHNIYRQGVVL